MLWPGLSQHPIYMLFCYLIWEDKLRDEDERIISHWMNKESAAYLYIQKTEHLNETK